MGRDRVVNLTTHEVVVMPDGATVTLRCPPSGGFARVDEQRDEVEPLDTIDGQAPVAVVSYRDTVVGLPSATPGTVYIVSRVTAAATNRADLYFPLDEIRDNAGRIVGCRRLGRFGARRLSQSVATKLSDGTTTW